MADTNDRGKDRDTYAEIQMTEIWQTEDIDGGARSRQT